ncbi:hypothetical protein MIND_00754300 [Mycena indigotica]|uniref:Uncharacterized protein n=1 Tax=Mycena indigotica TaxID=2126181 RepID=A0A8H6SMR3_9AGAR|nr:uncharacterized protein MIND_00754300 [Mycena indigotica]KAF7301883.1 hypothetical protein MIND_00754300 [Mycena indigotica]
MADDDHALLAAYQASVLEAPNKQPDDAMLATLGIKVRDYGINNPLPALKSIPSAPKPHSRALKRENGGRLYGVARTMPFDDPRPTKKPRLDDDDEAALRASCDEFFSASQDSQSQDYTLSQSQPGSYSQDSAVFSQTSGFRTPTISPNGSYCWPDGEPPPGVTEGSQSQAVQSQPSPPCSPTPRRASFVTSPQSRGSPSPMPLTPPPVPRNFSLSSLSSLSSLTPSPSPSPPPEAMMMRTFPSSEASSSSGSSPAQTPRYLLRTRREPAHKAPARRSKPRRPHRQESFTLEIRS